MEQLGQTGITSAEVKWHQVQSCSDANYYYYYCCYCSY